MKKNICLCIVVIVCTIVLFRNVCDFHLENVPDYKIHQSFITGAGNYKSVNLKVIVNIDDYEMGQLFDSIKKEYIKLNGVPDSLYIELFDSQYTFENGESSGSRTYKKR